MDLYNRKIMICCPEKEENIICTNGTAQSILKFRCKYQQESVNATMQHQISSMAWELKIYLRENQWMIRREDVGLINKPKVFFEKGSVHQLKRWVDRIQLSTTMVQYNNSKLLQDIR